MTGRRLIQTLALTVALSACANTKPFDSARCQLELKTRLDWGRSHEGWSFGKDPYLALVFDKEGGDSDLLDKYLQQRGYSQAANDPDDKSSRHTGYYFPNRDPKEETLPVADEANAPKVACEATYISGAQLKSINVMSDGSPVFRAELTQ
jgi:hypothetical protein